MTANADQLNYYLGLKTEASKKLDTAKEFDFLPSSAPPIAKTGIEILFAKLQNSIVRYLLKAVLESMRVMFQSIDWKKFFSLVKGSQTDGFVSQFMAYLLEKIGFTNSNSIMEKNKGEQTMEQRSG